MKKRILLISDVHYCHCGWYGVSSDERMESLLAHLREEYERDPYEMILFLGDYALDFWEWEIKGCYINEGRSYVREFVNKYCGRLPSPYMMIAGNHEQYGYEKWKEITGFSRRGSWTTDGWLFILLDSFGANLDPTEHSDGTYTPIDVDFVRGKMAEFPDRRVVLCGHHFDFDCETEEAKELVKDSRIVCLASGHVHRSDVVTLPAELGEKKLLHTGNYSYTSLKQPLESMWGYREVILTDDALISRYITPENTIYLGGQEVKVPYHVQDEVIIPV